MSALIYQPNHKWRIVGAFVAAVIIHLAALGFATTNRAAPQTAAGIPGDPPEILVEPIDPTPNPPPELSDPLPTPPKVDETFLENTATPPPIRKQASKSIPLVKPRTNTPPGSLNLSAAKVLALNAPRPEYPYEARRQKITGDGIAVLTIDPNSGDVTHVAMAKSTGNQFLDNAAVAGFSRWRFKPGTVSSVTCPITFTLTGASY
jgi:periplasmic protein TonB